MLCQVTYCVILLILAYYIMLHYHVMSTLYHLSRFTMGLIIRYYDMLPSEVLPNSLRVVYWLMLSLIIWSCSHHLLDHGLNILHYPAAIEYHIMLMLYCLWFSVLCYHCVVSMSWSHCKLYHCPWPLYITLCHPGTLNHFLMISYIMRAQYTLSCSDFYIVIVCAVLYHIRMKISCDQSQWMEIYCTMVSGYSLQG